MGAARCVRAESGSLSVDIVWVNFRVLNTAVRSTGNLPVRRRYLVCRTWNVQRLDAPQDCSSLSTPGKGLQTSVDTSLTRHIHTHLVRCCTGSLAPGGSENRDWADIPFEASGKICLSPPSWCLIGARRGLCTPHTTQTAWGKRLVSMSPSAGKGPEGLRP
jgi:hypothetical protein